MVLSFPFTVFVSVEITVTLCHGNRDNVSLRKTQAACRPHALGSQSAAGDQISAQAVKVDPPSSAGFAGYYSPNCAAVCMEGGGTSGTRVVFKGEIKV